LDLIRYIGQRKSLKCRSLNKKKPSGIIGGGEKKLYFAIAAKKSILFAGDAGVDLPSVRNA